MTFIQSVPERDATGETKAMYDEARATHGFVPNMTKAFSHRPDVMEAWSGLLGSIKSKMDPRRYELVTLAAAQALRSSYCMLAHGSVLLRDFYGAEALQSIVGDLTVADLDETDRAIMRFAEKAVRDAPSITRSDIEILRSHGLSDQEIFDVTAAATVRCFFSKTLDALGAQPDARYLDLDEDLREALTVGRPIETAED